MTTAPFNAHASSHSAVNNDTGPGPPHGGRGPFRCLWFSREAPRLSRPTATPFSHRDPSEGTDCPVVAFGRVRHQRR